MTVRFEQILTDGVATCSYFLGDEATGTAAVVDPRPDVEVYLERARHYGLAITHVFESHIHADFLSGARELVERLGGAAELCVSVEGGAEYGFKHRPIRDGDRFRFGGVCMEARATPGHTPEHIAFLLFETDREDPWGVLTGDSFFVDSVGRPDLLGDEQTDQLTEALFHTIRDFYLKLGNDVIIYPCHGAGSACGPDIGDRLSSTIGYERRYNPYTGIADLEAFRQAMKSDAPPVPTHYPHLKKVNAAGPPVLGNLPRVPALSVETFAASIGDGAQVLDTRDMQAFGAGHIDGALNIAARPELSVWAGWLLDPERPIYLVLERDRDLSDVLRLLWRTGFVIFGGYLAGGMEAWREDGRVLKTVRQMSVQELASLDDSVQPLDVRGDDEWNAGRIPGARHLFLGELQERMGDLDRNRRYATYCASGFRASIAASLLAANGFNDVSNVPGSWKAWTSAGYQIETPSKG
ncbi:MBL fold metallo-hydrolase [Thalassobaculum sp.]|uniref:MBL fold metallo-hydrolase n=1 Tax=Thalassobaculum sp. TaxID=2022740 RepID=UPI0032EB040B